jgi:D-3-phosphoglycerate dehydrogenase / 2-oxoglutarate reductase
VGERSEKLARKLKIVVTRPASKEELDEFHSWMTADCDIVAPKSKRIEDLLDISTDADVLVGTRIPQKAVDTARDLKMIQIFGTGAVDVEPGGLDKGFLFSSLEGKKILLGNSGGNDLYNSTIAEEGFAILLALTRRIIPAHTAYANGEWYPLNDQTFGTLLAGKTMGIIGLGRLGREVARRAVAFRMRVIATQKTPRQAAAKEAGVEKVYPPSGLHELLKQSDVVMVCCPLTYETYALIGEPELKSMKKSAYLINIARAWIVDEEPVYKALTQGWIAGFGSDVWWAWHPHAPIASTFGVHRLPNVVAINDRAVYTPETYRAVIKAAFENIDGFAHGRTPKYVVDIEKQY